MKSWTPNFIFSSVLKGPLRNEDIAYETLRFYTYVTRVLLDDLSDIIKTSNGSETWRNLVTYKNMLRGIESMAVEMSFGILFIGKPSRPCIVLIIFCNLSSKSDFPPKDSLFFSILADGIQQAMGSSQFKTLRDSLKATRFKVFEGI